MNDLFKGLIKAKGNRKYFYGEFSDLNDVEIPTEAEMFRIQLNNLRDLENSKSMQYQHANEFLRQATLRSQNMEGLEDEVSSELYARMVQLLNTGLWANIESNPTRRQAMGQITKDQKVEEIDKIMLEVQQILEKINVNKEISKNIVESLELRLRKQSGATNKDYTNLKANQAEQLMVEALNKNEGWQALQTGNFVDALGQQLIEDVMTFQKGTKLGGTFSFTVTNKDSKQGVNLHATSVQDLLNKISKLSDQYTVHLSAPLYDALKQASILNAQVKSGMNAQPILTRSERNSTSFNEIGFVCGRLEELYNLAGSEKWFKTPAEQNSKDLEALANYSLSQAIAQTNLNRNQLYYTEQGFSTASQWMEQNMYMLKFNPGVTSMTPDFRALQRKYQLRKAKA
jgi:hypothetical protein